MRAHIQSKSENHINIFFDFFELSALKQKEIRSAFICKSEPSIYLGGHVQIKDNKIIFDNVDKSQFEMHKVDFALFENETIHHLGEISHT